MTSQQIEYILVLTEEGNFSKAAQRLYLSQPALSQFIRNLEDKLGTQLFDRSCSPIKLTQAGQYYVDAAKRIQTIERTLQNELSDLLDLQCGTLTIGTTPFRAAYLLPKSIAAFQQAYQGIQIQVVEAPIHELEQSVLNGELDMLIGTAQLDARLFHSEFLAQERLYLAISEDHPLHSVLEPFALSADDIRTSSARIGEVATVPLSMLSSERIILPRQEEYLYHQMELLCAQIGSSDSANIHVKHMETVFSFILNQIGIGFLPDTLIRYGNYAKHPCYYALAQTESLCELKLMSKRNRYLTRAAQEYIRILKQLIGMGTWENI